MSPTEVAFFSLISALIAALLAHLLTVRRKKRDELADLRLRAYTDFVQATSRLAAARRTGKTHDELEDLAALNDAKVRMCICAGPSVVNALAEFWAHGGTLEKESELLAFSRLCRSLREDVGNAKNDIRDIDLPATLFRLQPSGYSYKAEVEAAKSKHAPESDA